MPDDLYSTLGVKKTASDADIKKAYKKLVKKLHPDLNPGDSAAEERFKKVSAAFDILGDPERRKRYDKGEIDATGAERPRQHFYHHYAGGEGGERYHRSAGFDDFAGFSSIYEDLFGGRGGRGPGFRMRGADRRYHLDLDFLDAVYGARRRLTMPDGSVLDVNVPAGIRDGDTLRLKGKGDSGIGGGPPGDAMVEVSVRAHPLFARNGDDIETEVPITIDLAVLGGKIEVPTISGPVTMTVPKGVSSGTTLRLKGRGVRAKGRKPGDQHVKLRIVLPAEIDPKLEEMMQTWRQDHAYDPRDAGRKDKGKAA